MRVEHDVHFLGWVSTSEKHRRMAQAHALLMASVREGWGLVVIESNACGTPAIVYNVHGLRDAVRNGDTGLVVEPTPTALARAMQQLVTDERLHAQLRKGARSFGETFSFDLTAKVVTTQLEGVASAPQITSITEVSP
jgi:glycosyltransferase involved in cell wall biosynthesis